MLALSVLMVAAASWARTADDIISELRDAKHAQYVNVGSGLMGLARIFTTATPNATNGVSSVRVLDLSDCKKSVRKKFHKRVDDLYKEPAYQEMLANDRDNDGSVIFTMGDDQYVREIVIVREGRNDMIVVIRGNISVEDVRKVVGNDTYYPIK